MCVCVVSYTLVLKTVPKRKFINSLSSVSITGVKYIISCEDTDQEFASD